MKHDVFSLSIGLMGSAVALTPMQNLEIWLRISTLCAGLFVTLLSGYSIYLSIRWKRKNRK